jgi:hypothetical protein
MILVYQCRSPTHSRLIAAFETTQSYLDALPGLECRARSNDSIITEVEIRESISDLLPKKHKECGQYELL